MKAIRLLIAALAAVVVAGCGNVVEAVRSGGTGMTKVAVASGVIEGLGSIVVNGVRFDEAGAAVTINGVPGRPVSDLRLGMVVEVRGTVDPDARTGRADSVVASALIAGPVSAVDLAAGEFTVLGQRVELKSHSVLEGLSSLAGLSPGDRVVVYGFWDYVGAHVDATRVERHAPSPAAAIIGRVTATQAGGLRIGALSVDITAAVLEGLAGGVTVGRYVEARGSLANGMLVADRLVGRSEFDPVEGAFTELEGYVTDLASPQSFRVLGTPVDASAARVSGVAPVGAGAFVEVEGRIVAGVLVAALVEVKSAPQSPAAPEPRTVAGEITDFVSAASFRVRDQAIDASGAAFTGGTAAELANGRSVQVTGLVDGSVLRATTLAFAVPAVPPGTRTFVTGTIDRFASPQSFRVNGQPVVVTAATVFSGGTVQDLADGRLVDVDGLLTEGVLSAWSIVLRAPPAVVTVTLEGAITDFASPANFRVNNQAISAGPQTVYEDGTASRLAAGVRVKVTGTLAGGVVSAMRIEFRETEEAPASAEVEGSISAFTSVASFTVKGQLIDASTATFSGGRASDLAVGVKVHVKGPVTAGVLKARTLEMSR